MTAPITPAEEIRVTAPELSPEEVATVARFDAAPTPPEVVVEIVARALWDSDPDVKPSGQWPQVPYDAETYRPMALAAIAAMPPSPAEEAIEPGLSAESNGRRLAWFTDDELSMELARRAALASPAPAPQTYMEQGREVPVPQDECSPYHSTAFTCSRCRDDAR